MSVAVSPTGLWIVMWKPGTVEVLFPDGLHTLLDYGHMPPDQASWYAGVARLCGYDDPALYARHHDVIHCWLAERLWGITSPTLRAVAMGRPAPPINKSEEYLVNTVQWTLATGRFDWHAEYLRQVVGDDWVGVLAELKVFLDWETTWPLELTSDMNVDVLLARNELPLETLKELEAKGFIHSAAEWGRWLEPGVHWISPTEYADAFKEQVIDVVLTDDGEMTTTVSER